jgi:hypothetical protein
VIWGREHAVTDHRDPDVESARDRFLEDHRRQPHLVELGDLGLGDDPRLAQLADDEHAVLLRRHVGRRHVRLRATPPHHAQVARIDTVDAPLRAPVATGSRPRRQRDPVGHAGGVELDTADTERVEVRADRGSVQVLVVRDDADHRVPFPDRRVDGGLPPPKLPAPGSHSVVFGKV